MHRARTGNRSNSGEGLGNAIRRLQSGSSTGLREYILAQPLTFTLTLSAPVKFDDLLAAYEWVSSSSSAESDAFVSRVTGKIHWSSSMMELDEELSEDIEDGSIYVAMPHKYDLNLGKNLALTFTEEQLEGSYETVSNLFRQRGVYGKFKDLLVQKGKLEAWYEFEAKATELALCEWAAEQELSIVAGGAAKMRANLTFEWDIFEELP